MKLKAARSSVVFLCAVAIGFALALLSVADFDLNTAVGIWHMDEGEGDMAADSSASGDDGTLWREPAWVDGKFGKALQFDGQSFVWMREAKGVVEGVSPRTLMCHFKWNEINDWGDAIHWLSDAEALISTGKHNFHQSITLMIASEGGVGGGLGVESFADRLYYVWDADTEWHHLAAVLPDDGQALADFQIYFDGELQEETEFLDALGGDVATVGGEIAIASWTGGPSNFFNGTLDDVAVFPYAMPAEDIANIAKRGLVKGQALDVSPRSKLATSWGALKERD